MKTKNSSGGDTVGYYHHDHLGTPLQATDKGGNIVWAARYEAFGGATITTPAGEAGTPAIESSLRLPGQVEDVETGLHYNWHRYYENKWGRYIQLDPIRFKGGINLYGYANNQPTIYTDPLGLFAGDGHSNMTREALHGNSCIDVEALAQETQKCGLCARQSSPRKRAPTCDEKRQIRRDD